MTAAIVFGATARPSDPRVLRAAALSRILRGPGAPSREGTVDRKPIRRSARRAASIALIAGAVSFAAPAIASAAAHVDGIQGTGHAVQINGIQGTGHAAQPDGIQGSGH